MLRLLGFSSCLMFLENQERVLHRDGGLRSQKLQHGDAFGREGPGDQGIL